MSESSETTRTSVSDASSIEEIGDYWDTHSLADHWDETQEVDFTVTAKRRHRVSIDPEIFEQIAVQARARGLQPETLVNLWLVQQLKAAA